MRGPLSLAQIATRLGGGIAGPQEVLIHQVGSLERAGPGQVTYFSDPRFRARLRDRVRSLEKLVKNKEKGDG